MMQELVVLRIYGMDLKKIFEDEAKREEIFGSKTKNMKQFPLLVKFIDAKDNLSVQVHPNDEYAKQYENDIGKTEMWYVMDCDENAKIICGMKEEVKQEEIADIIKQGKLRDNLKEVSIHKGDIIYIPAGTVHAILKGTLICEIQQNSNLTYRVYDWNRMGKDGKPRELHIEKAIDVIRQDANNKIVTTKEQEPNTCQNRISCDCFKVDSVCVQTSYFSKTMKDTFEACMVVNGSGLLRVKDKEYNIKMGDSFILPANLGEYELEGKLEILKAYL